MSRPIRDLMLVFGLGLTLALSLAACGSASPPPRISLSLPARVEPGVSFAVTGSIAGGPERARVRVQASRDGVWRVLASGPVQDGRYRLRAKLPADIAGARVRSVLAAGGRVIARSPGRWVFVGSKAAAPSAPAAPSPAETATAPPPPLPPDEGPAPAPGVPEPAPGDMYWGGWIEDAPYDWTAVEEFEAHAGKGISLLEFSTPFEACSGGKCIPEAFPATYFQKIRDHGAIPFFSWGSQTSPIVNPDPSYELSDLARGEHDAYIREWAEAAAAWHHPFFLRFDWEMNGNWFNWGQGFNNNTAADYLAAWKHVHAIFDEVGATNATWVWCPFVNPNGSANIADPAAFYPGDEYVDWTCLDGYNWGTNTTPKRNWHSFEFWFGSTYDRLRQIAPAKPMLVGETGSSEFGGSKAQWLSEMFAALPTRFPALRGLIYFDVIDAEHDWPIETSPEAQAAFAAGIADSRYRGSEFGSLGSNPIPAP